MPDDPHSFPSQYCTLFDKLGNPIDVVLNATTGEYEMAVKSRITDSSGGEMTLEPNGSMPVTNQGNHTPIVIIPFTHLQQSTTTTVGVAIGDRTVTLASVTDVSAGKLLTFFNPTSIRYMIARCVGAPVGNVVTLDRLFDFAYPSGSIVDISSANLAVDGSITPVLFGLRNNQGAIPPPGIDLTFKVTRLIFQCVTTGLSEIDMFGDIVGGLVYGLFCRVRNGEYQNIFNAQTNGELSGIMYDLDIYETSRFGSHGFAARLTFEKMGTTILLPINEDMEIMVQDNLTDLLRFSIIAEGSIIY